MTTINRKALPLFCIILTAGLILGPVQAAEKYLGESPDLAVSIAGANEYYPGKEVTISVLVENRATPGTKIIAPGQDQWPDRPTTAKLVRVALLPGDAPVIIRTDPQMIGDLPLGSSRSVPFQVKIPEGARGGTYTLPVDLQYTSISFAEQVGTDTQILHYKDANITPSVEVKVRPRLVFTVTNVTGAEISSGQEGELAVTIRNNGTFKGRDATVRIIRHDGSPVIPVEGSAYIGDFAPGDSFSTMFRVRVPDDAQGTTYPLDLVIRYRDDEDDLVDSDRETIGVPVHGRAEFSIEPAEVTIPRGLSRDIALTIRNTGPVTLRSAQARVKVIEPFSSSKYTAALGDLAPGEEATVTVSLAVDKSATRKVYGLDTEIQYRDALDNIVVTSPSTLRIAVVDRNIIESVTTNPVSISIIVAVILGAVYFYYRRKKGE
ncbi:MAG: COG1361 S-layer family protein [Methanolinea tarda]|jgi:uncharacterized membrane protein